LGQVIVEFAVLGGHMLKQIGGAGKVLLHLLTVGVQFLLHLRCAAAVAAAPMQRVENQVSKSDATDQAHQSRQP
jgi:hypothetical protein